MASIINKISFKNFFNYYGDFDDPNTTYELEEGLNIIVADNGAGKSKFFNAFLWLFNDQILDSDDKITKNVKDVCVKILSDKAKNETIINQSVECGFRIEYTSGTSKKYQITKSFRATRLGEAITDDSSWSFMFNSTEVNSTELVLTKFKPVYDEEDKRYIIERLISPAFRRYSFLQGEEVDQIIDFGKKESIEEAVQNLTNIKKYEQIVDLTNEFKEKAEKDLRNQTNANAAIANRMAEAIGEKEKFNQELNNELAKLEQFRQMYQDAEDEFSKLDKMHANAKKRDEIDRQLADERKTLREKVKEFEEFLDRINNRFFDGNSSWIAMGFQAEVDKFSSMNQTFIEKHFEKKTLKNIEDKPNEYFSLLPVNSPDSVSLKNMKDAEHCYVCDRPAKEGTPPHDHILRLLDRTNSDSKQIEYVKNNLKDFFGYLQNSAQPFYNKIDGIKESVLSVKKKEQELKERIDKLKEKVKSINDQRADIIVAGNNSESSDKDIISSYRAASKRMETASVKIEDIVDPKIKYLRGELKKIDQEIGSINQTQDIPQGFKDHYSISIDLAEAAERAKERVYDNMIQKLEEHANVHFKNLIANNDLAGGILKFEKNPSGSISFNYVDSKGNLVSGSSEGFQRMKKFSVVMAIITSGNQEYNYPLLADAPISAFGEAFTEGFFEASGEVFPQSIVLVKELYDRNSDQKITQLGQRLLKDDNVKTMYVNQVPKDAEQIDLVTTKMKLK
jgi:DNA sulfur modification protein DndD